jgi:hypothetical protein
VLTNQISLAETPTFEDLTDWAERREAMRIRPLTDCPRLRAAMGGAVFLMPVAATAATPTPKASKSKKSKRMPKNASAPAVNARTKTATKHAAERRFDRRALLESDR